MSSTSEGCGVEGTAPTGGAMRRVEGISSGAATISGGVGPVLSSSQYVPAMIVAMGLSLPWVLQQMMSYSTSIITNIPNVIAGQ